MMVAAALGLSGAARPALAATASAAATPFIEELTWTELRDRVAAGATTVIVPVGGTEQSGPHMVLGKHNVRAHVLAGRIASKLGNALVAPVLAYVPEGSITPPTAHMRFPGTITISDATFEALLESTARSFRQHGFRTVVFIGDHGGYQKSLEKVAAKLDREWRAAPTPCRAVALLEYYRVTQSAFVAALKARGHSAEEIGTHAGLADTALSLAIDPALVHPSGMPSDPKSFAREGVYGDPRRATAELGRIGVEQIVDASVAAIRALTSVR
ncbi:MAG TPA: creatininase family protein [Burkholderiaceae bacterium]|nr:creatininase family protein [Burkholderiaceae bacterium]